MTYEKIRHDNNKSIKLTYDDIDKILHLYNVEHWKKSHIAEKFNVSYSCIDYHLMTLEQKQRKNRKSYECNAKRITHDERYRKHILDNHGVWAKKNKESRPDFNDWRNEMSSTQRDKDNALGWAIQYRLDNSKVISEKQKLYNALPETKEHRRKYNKSKWEKVKNDPILHAQHKQKFKQWRTSPDGVKSLKKYGETERRKELQKANALSRKERYLRDPYFGRD